MVVNAFWCNKNNVRHENLDMEFVVNEKRYHGDTKEGLHSHGYLVDKTYKLFDTGITYTPADHVQREGVGSPVVSGGPRGGQSKYPKVPGVPLQ